MKTLKSNHNSTQIKVKRLTRNQVSITVGTIENVPPHSVPRGGKKSNFVMPPNNSKIISVFSRGQLRVILIDFGLISILLCEF